MGSCLPYLCHLQRYSWNRGSSSRVGSEQIGAREEEQEDVWLRKLLTAASESQLTCLMPGCVKGGRRRISNNQKGQDPRFILHLPGTCSFATPFSVCMLLESCTSTVSPIDASYTALPHIPCAFVFCSVSELLGHLN